MDRVYEILIRKVQDYDGTVDEMTGDGIMALFVAPIAIEDAPQRAIKASLAIHREMAKFSDKLTDEGLPPIKMRSGINTGTVVVGALGNDLRVEFKAVGNTVNIASRIEGPADPGTTFELRPTCPGDWFQPIRGPTQWQASDKKLQICCRASLFGV